MLPLAPIPRTYATRVLAVGDAAGLVKATTGGGIYYSLLSAGMASDVLGSGPAGRSPSGAALQPYETAWKARLGPELKAQLRLRLLSQRLSDADIDAFFELARTDGVMPIVRKTAQVQRAPRPDSLVAPPSTGTACPASTVGRSRRRRLPRRLSTAEPSGH